ncbi:MAG: nucleotidyltransferase domain-containing protein [Hyphomonadaceae bacterium]|nr:nucleotidyltransferase domain-containing protein [Clostridia bacterium]
MDTGLNENTLNLMNQVFMRYNEIEKVYIFGSRAKGNYKPNSDIDLAIAGNIDRLLSEKIAMQLDDLPLPYKFDVQAYDHIKNTQLKAHIDRIGVVIYDK